MKELHFAAWEGLLTTRALGLAAYHCYEETDSTNLRLRQLALDGAPHGTVCVAETQTAGRGRLGRSWHSPAGQGLWASVLLRPAIAPADAPLVTLLAAMAMAQAVTETAHLPCGIKWPNDLVAGGKKLCGVLLEISADETGVRHLIVGTGLNVRKGAYPPELAHQATSVEDLVPPPARGEILAAYLNALEALMTRLENGEAAGLLQAYAARSVTLGSRVQVIGATTFTGTAEAVDETGALLVRDEEGTLRRVLSGDVSVRGVMGYV